MTLMFLTDFFLEVIFWDQRFVFTFKSAEIRIKTFLIVKTFDS